MQRNDLLGVNILEIDNLFVDMLNRPEISKGGRGIGGIPSHGDFTPPVEPSSFYTPRTFHATLRNERAHLSGPERYDRAIGKSFESFRICGPHGCAARRLKMQMRPAIASHRRPRYVAKLRRRWIFIVGDDNLRGPNFSSIVTSYLRERRGAIKLVML